MPMLTPEPSSRFGTDPTDFFCMPFNRVLHVVHVDELSQTSAALNSGPLHDAGSPSDVSGLARLVPDTWTCGYFSGNVALEYDWVQLIRDFRFYWLDTEPQTPELCRILVTKRCREGLLEYNPSVDSGPWRKSESGAHTWNSRFGLEFLFEGELPVSSITRFFCVKHDVRRCSGRGIHCTDLGVGSRTAGALLLATLLGGSPAGGELARVVDRTDRESWLSWLSALVRRLSRCPVGGAVHSGTSEARELAHRTAAAFAGHDKSELLQLMKQFASHKDVADELRQILFEGQGHAPH